MLSAGIIISVGFTSCESCIVGNGPLIVENREVEPYSKLDVNIPAYVKVTPGEDLSVRIEAQENLLPRIKTSVSGKTLVIKSKPCLESDKPIRIELIVPMLTSIDINGSAAVKITEMMNTEDFKVGINGSGEFAGDVFANSVEADINGSGDIIINGSAKMLEVEINGSGDFSGLGLKTFEADIVIRGSGDVRVNALNKLQSEVLGSGDVWYVGNPEISTSIKGSGQVSKMK